MYTANTMAAAIEALGMSLPYSSSNPALSEEKKKECLAAGMDSFLAKPILLESLKLQIERLTEELRDFA